MNKNDVVTIEITGMTTEGNGVGRHDGMAIFVPLTAIGDVIEARITKLMKSYAFGIIERIITPSASRIESDCEVFAKCGGCAFRHISYDAELLIKDGFVRDAFKRIGKLDVDFDEILGCKSPNYYRNKAQYPVAEQNGKAVCGFYSKRSHRVVPFTACKLQPGIFEQIVNTIIEQTNALKIRAYNEENHTGILRHIYIRKGFHTDETMVCFVVTNWCEHIFAPIVKILTERFPNIKSIIMNKNSENTNVILGRRCRTLFGNDEIIDIMCGNKISLSPLSFYQVNTEQAEHIYEIAKEYCGLTGTETILDLYCGAGTIGLSMASNAKKIIGVEVISAAVENARKNAEINSINNAEFICGDAGETAKMLIENGETPDVIIIDPPRKGCDEEILTTIADMHPEKIIMISCNPATAARDCATLNKNGYHPIKARAIDMFPRTGHVETVVLMSRVDK